MQSYGFNIEWDGHRWIDSDDKEFPNRMDPDRCSQCRAKHIVFGNGGRCSQCDPSNPQWEVYRLAALKLGRDAPEAPLS